MPVDLTFILISAALVFVFSGLLAMAGLGAAFLFVPLFYYMGVPLPEATATAMAAGTTALVVIFASLSGFLGHASVSSLDPLFLAVTAVMAAAGSIVGSQLMKTRLSSAQLKRMIGVLLWVIAAKMIFDLL